MLVFLHGTKMSDVLNYNLALPFTGRDKWNQVLKPIPLHISSFTKTLKERRSMGKSPNGLDSFLHLVSPQLFKAGIYQELFHLLMQ